MSVRIQLRRDTAANWASINPILAQSEPGYVTDTRQLKMGDAVTAWSSLPYFSSGEGGDTFVDTFNSAVSGAPGPGDLLLNNAIMASVTGLSISKFDTAGTDIH